jgi:SAM-dependent methyltransferase
MINQSVFQFFKQKLSPEAFVKARLYWWQTHFYFPHRIGSVVTKKKPKVHTFSAAGSEQPWVSKIRTVNVFKPTEMCRVMTKHGSDKGRGWHNYTTIYPVLFSGLRDKQLKIFEVGLGTDNPSITSSMGARARPGASLRGWREIFPNASIYGADIDKDILFEEDRISTFYCDQLSSDAIRNLWAQPALRGGADIIIDDGLHTFEANVSFLKDSLKHLKPGGIFVVEDIAQDALKRWHTQVKDVYRDEFPEYEFALLELPNSDNNFDNNMLIVRER